MTSFKFPFLYFLTLLSFAFIEKAKSQENISSPSLSSEPLTTDDLSQFHPSKSTKWIIAGNISADRDQKNDLETKNGKGVLVYLPKLKGDKALETKLKHGDIDLNLDFLLSKSASFSILFQGRYEVKITDAWLSNANNAMRAPGLWQNLSVRFRASEFDSRGSKIKDAVLEQILINGQQVQGSTKILISEHSSFRTESETGPLVILGEISPFAIRNISYKIYEKDEIKLTDIKFKVYPGLHKNIDTLLSLKPKRTGITDSISHQVGDRKSQLVFNGFAEIPTDGEYLFKLTAGGGAWLFIDGKLVIENKGSRDFEKAFYAKQKLKKGKFPFRIVYSNSDECLVLHYEGPQIPWHSLTTNASVRLSEKFDPLEYKVRRRPVIQRGFMLKNGIINPYIVSVGIPTDKNSQGLNYAYDMKKFSLTTVWHGKYIDVSNMWTERGEKQLEIPLGARLELPGKPILAKKIPESSVWPDSVQAPEGVYSNRGYKLGHDGFPIFYYALDGVSIEDSFVPNQDRTGLTRLLKIKNPVETSYCLLAEGKVIEKVSEGNFSVDDKQYYIAGLETGATKATVYHGTEGDKLVVSIPAQQENSMIKFDIIW
ncbi:PA14 domain-containing protein [Dyadobacter koreensis]|uniref:PA14 domain-containing protein n=1 Tax=Dyadobacter koreensis TaxID=408657 RepID=A0A1H6XV65_9BACT|nr:PA14 domain-containing protein [Dyadobacter koreensis]SEJ30657.1 PA14 domain-containing protein [Dyadobacter koreensis]